MKRDILAVLLSASLVAVAARQTPTAADASTAVAAPAGGPRVVRTVRWSHGDEPIRLMPTDQGFCYLSGAGGNFEGGGEGVRIYPDDEFWCVGGSSCQPSLWVEVTCVEWPAPRRHRHR